MLSPHSIVRFFILACILLGLASCDSGNRHQGDISFYIPESSVVILRTSSLEDLSSDFKNNSLLSKATAHLWDKNLKDKLGYLDKLQLDGASYICLSIRQDSVYDITLITKQHDRLMVRDSLDTISAPSIKLMPNSLGTFNIDNTDYFTTVIDSVLVSSTNKSLVIEAQEKKTPSYAPSLKKLLNALPDNAPGIFINNQEKSGFIPRFFSQLPLKDAPIEPWTGLNFKILPGELSFSGVTISIDSTQTPLTAFKNTLPQKLAYASVVPQDAAGVVALSYDNFDLFANQLNGDQDVADSLEITRAFMSSTVGTSLIYGQNSPALVFEPVDLTISLELLTPALETLDEYKGVTLYKLNQDLPTQAMLSPYIDSLKTNQNFVFVLADQIVSCKERLRAEGIISQHLNNNTLATSAMYLDAKATLRASASITMIALQPTFKQKLAAWSTDKTATVIDAIDFKKYPLGIVQFEAQGNFTHINGLFKEAASQTRGAGIKELLSLKHNTPIIVGPQFFSNHRSGGKDIVFQDANNKLLLYSANGTKLWEKQLDGPILGKISEVELLRNRKIQLAFTTAKTLYILDRNGREVAPFPIKFKDKVTQPLAVFDYDNNRKYRFVITQGDQILMYDSNAKIVKGFTFTKAQSNLAFAPKHFRIGNKDYIAIAESSGKLHIKSRVGKDRINIKKTFNFGTIAPLEEDGSFVIITKDYTKETISTSGKVTSKNLGVSNDFALSVAGKIKVSLDDNLLRIKGRLIELPFGIYTAPEIYFVRRVAYIALTDTQTKKLYVYNSGGDLLPNFPIFGTGTPTLGDANNNRDVNVLVPGDENAILLYEFR